MTDKIINRRRFLEITSSTIAGIGLSSLFAGCQVNNKTISFKKRPNILFILTDQQSAGAMSCVGNKDVKTPAIDSIAKNGVIFERVYCSQPLCCPARTSMLTGKWPHEINIQTNNDYGTQLNKISALFIGRIMTNAGYDCAHIGKWHFPVSPERKDIHGFDTVEYAKFNGVDEQMSQSCVDFIKKNRKRPFFLVASFVNPHDICEWARGDKLPNGDIPDAPDEKDCPPLPANFEIPKDEPEILRYVQRSDKVVYPVVGWKPAKWRQYRWAYYRLIELVDKRIGIILDAVHKAGLEENTLIIFSSDHGDGCGAHRWNQKQILYEEVVRVPFIVSLKGVTKAGSKDREYLISNCIDLMPTICDYADIGKPQGLVGQSVRPIAEGNKPKNWRSFVVSETAFSSNVGGDKLMIVNGNRIKGRMLRSNRYKYIAYSEGSIREQLFDIDKDSGEMTNLAYNPRYKTVLNEHRLLLAKWCKENNDSFTVPKTS